MAESFGQLYVGDLSHDITETELYSFFNSFGKIVKIAIIRKEDGLVPSSAYAFITFDNMTSAQLARSEANGKKLKNRNIFVMLYSKDIHKNEQANIFVKNLPSHLTVSEFEKLFQSFGNVISSKISFDINGESRGYGFVQFATPDQADRAVEASGRLVIGDHKLTIDKFTPKSQRTRNSVNNVYVRGFSDNFREEDLQHSFEIFGKITSKIIMRDAQGNSRLFGFVCFEDPETAANAVREMNGKENAQFGFTWFVSQFMNKNERLYLNKKKYAELQEQWKKRNLIVSGLPSHLNEDQLKKLFSEYGPVESLKIVTADNFRIADTLVLEKKSTGKAFVCFQHEADADNALAKLQHMKVNDSEIKVKRWMPKNEILKIINRNKFFVPPPMMMPPPPPYMKPQGQMMGRGRGYPGQFGQNRFPQNNQMYPPRQQFQGQRPNYQPRQTNQMSGQEQKPRYQPRDQALRQPVQVKQEAPIIQPVLFNYELYKAADPVHKKQMIGEAIYTELNPIFGQFTGKITGMLIEIGEPEILQILGDKSKLKAKANEALEVLKQHLGIN